MLFIHKYTTANFDVAGRRAVTQCPASQLGAPEKSQQKTCVFVELLVIPVRYQGSPGLQRVLLA